MIGLQRECVRRVLVTMLATMLQAGAAYADSVFPGHQWERIDATRAGWSAVKLAEVRAMASEGHSSALLVIQNGRIVFDWGRTTEKISLHSVRKSLLNSLYGIAVTAHQIDLDATLNSLGIDDSPFPLTAVEKQATVRNLLMARSGVYIEAAAETESMKRDRPARGSHPPGTFFYYNNWDFNVLGTILEQHTGQSVLSAFAGQIARPIGMQDFTDQDGGYKRISSSRYAAYSFSMTARDLARFGWLYLNHGRWGNRSVVPATWVRDSTHPWSDAKPGVAYGLLWWVSTAEWQFGTTVGFGSYSARGAGGQFLVVLPAYNMVVVHLCDTESRSRTSLDCSKDNSDFGRILKAILAAQPGGQ